MTNETKPTGGPAFPEVCNEQIIPGMRLRDYFAAKAMQAEYGLLKRYDQFKSCAECAYAMADAMLEVRGK